LRKASLHQCLLNHIHNDPPSLWPGAFVAYGAAASSASRLAIIAPLLLQTETGRPIAHLMKKLLALKGKTPAESHRIARCWEN